ncbi:MAG: hypothetical protein ACKO2G_16105 [Verrucomicrobiales bacterium]
MPEGFASREVNTGLLGRPLLVNEPFTDPEARPIALDTDYFGKLRGNGTAYPGPFSGAVPGDHRIKVWPKGE